MKISIERIKTDFRNYIRGLAVLLSIFTLLLPNIASAMSWDDINDIVNQHSYFAPNDSPQSCESVATGSSIDRFLQALALQESSGNPLAENPNPNTTASGKYQYLDTTWQSNAKAYYPPGAAQYARAKDAPEAVQDAVAYIEYTQKFQDLGNDLVKLAITHYVGHPPTDAEMDTIPHPEAGNTQTLRQYGEAVVKKIDEGFGLSIPLLYSQAPDFQTWFTAAGGSGTSTVNPTAGSCQNGVTTEGFVFYSQYDARWSNHPFGTSTIAASGCGPSSIAMIVATLKDRTVTPVEVADFGTENGGYDERFGSTVRMFLEGPRHWGLTGQDLGRDMNRAIQVLNSGGLVLAGGIGPTPFTDVGHIIVLRGITTDGRILIGDPAHPDLNNTPQDSAELLKSITGLYGVTL